MKKIKRKIKTVVNNPWNIIIKLLEKWPFLSTDKFFIKILFRSKLGYYPNLNKPQTFNEKLNWLKLNYRKPILNTLVDKYSVKQYIRDRIGEEFIIPTLGVWDSFDEINFDQLPDKFVLKTTHDGGGVVICTEKSLFDKEKARIKLNKHLKSNHYNKFREWPYKDVKPRIIAEKYICDANGAGLKDFKFYCFEGKAKILFIASDREGKLPKFDFYDIDFNHLDISRPNAVQSLEKNEKPYNYTRMIDLAENLSKGFPHVRVDFYNAKGNIYFGEFTFFTGAGIKPFYPKKWDKILGDLIVLPKNI